MNQIFRVIWSQATQTWVAVSELTKAHKKQSATSTAQESAVKFLGQFFKLSTLTFAMLGATQAYAEISVATVANEVPDTDVLKGVTLTAQATSKNEKNNSTPTTLDDGTQIKYNSGGTLVDLKATDLKDAVGKLSTNSSSATVTEGTLVDLLNRIRTQYVSINSDSGTNQYNTGAKTYAEAKNGIAIGSNAVVTDSGSIALGYGAKNERVIESGNEMQRAANAVSIGTNALTTFSGSIALGANTEARGESAIVIGQNAHTFSPWDEANKRYVQAYRSILMGFNANASGTNTIGIGSRVQSFANNAIVMGFDAQAKHEGAVVIGLKAQSKGGLDQGLGTVTIGQEASAASSDQNRSSVAVGKRAYTGGSFGYNSTAFNRNQIDGASMSYNSTAIGSNAGTGYNYVDIATTALTGSDNKAIPAGTVLKRHIIRDYQGNATGVEFYSGEPRDDGTGKLIYNSVKTADLGSVRSGYVANMGTSTDNNETVLKKSGFNPKEDSKEYTETFSSKAGSAKGIAYLLTGSSNIANNEQTAIGAESRAIGDSSVAVGTRAIAGTSSVVVGATSTDVRSSPWNRQVFVVEDGIEYYSKLAYGARNDFNLNSTGLTNNDSKKSDKVALSVYTELTGRNFANWNRKDAPYGVDGSVVVGSGAHSSAGLGVAQGATSSVMKGALGGIAIGAASTVDVNSRGAVALGMGSIVDVQADGAMALGMGSTVISSNTKKATNAIAIGTKAKADVANSVAIGSGATTVGNSATREKTGTITKEIAPGVTQTMTYGTFYGTPGVGTATAEAAAATPGYMISVGDASTNTYRQIKNVAAGAVSEKSTDAINGSQLFAVTKFMTEGWQVTGNDTATIVNKVSPTNKVSFINGTGTTSTVKANGNDATTVTFDINAGNGITIADNKVTVKADGDTINIGDNGIKVNTGSITAGDKASVTEGDKNKIATAGNVAEAINAAAWKATSGTEGTGAFATGNTTAEQPVKAGDTVTFKAGDNLVIKQSERNFTYSLNPVLSGLTSAGFKTSGDNPTTTKIDGNGITIQAPKAGDNQEAPKAVSVTKDGISAGDKAITDVASNLPNTQNNTAATGQPSNATTSQKAPSTTGDNAVNTNNAATVGDVLNAGWNLQGNGSAVDFVKPYDTVNFENGTNTTVVASTDGSTSNIKINVTGLPITYTDANGNQVAQTKDGKWYPVDKNGSPDTKKTEVPANSVKTNLANANPTDGKTSTTSPTQLGNVTSGLSNYTNANNGNVAPRNNIVNLGDANSTGVSDNTAATVGDLRNMGWVVSSDKTTGNLGTAYSEAVKNANEVKFVGEGSAIVSGKTDDGVRTITVAVDSQSAVEKAQIPVVYTDAAGNKLTKVGDEFYPADSVVIDGKRYPKGSKKVGDKVMNEAGTEEATALNPTKKDDIIASMNNGDNNAAPTTLSNVKSNLPNVSDANKNATDVNGYVIKDSTNTKAPISAADAANYLAPTIKNEKGENVANPNFRGNNAATVSDVLNAGWNLQNNGEARDFVKPYDTVNFVNGGNTVAVVTTAADGTTSDVTFNVTGLPTTFTTADGSPVSKVGDNYYKVDKNGQPVSDKGKPAVGKNTDGNYVDEDGNVINPIDTASNPLKTNLVNPNVANSTTAPNNQTNTATQLGNVANGANTIAPVDKDGNALKLANNGKYYPADQVNTDGSLKDETKATEAQPLKLANDGKWYPANQVSNRGVPTGDSVTPPSSMDPKAGLIDFANSNPNNAATVGDLQNMGWVVSSDKTTGNLGTAYSDQVRNANEVRFVGTNLATVSGTTDENGVRIITVDVDAQKTVETAQNPVVYTDKQGNKLTKVGDNFYKPEDVANAVVNGGKAYPAGSVVIDGNVYPEGTTKNEAGQYVNNAGEEVKPVTEITPVKSGDIIASMNSGDNKTEPTKLANVGSNLKQVVDPTTNADGSPRKGTVNNPDGTQAKDGDNNDVTATNTAPISAKDAANLLQPYELNADGTVKKDADGNPVRNANYIGNNAATVSDVLNAGWNLQNNGEARDFVKPYDTVNFVNGGNTVAVVTTAADGTSSDVTFNVTGLPTTFTTADGSPVSKVGDNYYKVDKNGQPVSDAGKPAVGKNADGNYVDADGNVINPINTASNPLKTNLVNPNVANTDAAPNNQTSTATQLGNVANGANTIAPVDKDGNALKLANNGKYYPADQVNDDGSLKDEANSTEAQPLKLANDGKWYPANQVNANGSTTEGAAPVTTQLNPGKSGLIDFTNSNPNNAATVGDLQNMGWVVSSDKTTGNLGTAYNDQVRNANEVKFVGTGLATVSGKTDENGVRVITVDVKTGEVVPTDVVMKDDANTKVTKIGDKYYKASDIDTATGKPKAGATEVPADQVTNTANNGAGLVTGNQVADAIQQSGFVIGKQTSTLANDDFKNQDERVNPDDNVRFADGNNTNVKLATKETVDASGKVVTTTTVKVDVVGLPIAHTLPDGTQVTKVGDNYYPLNVDGSPNTDKPYRVIDGNIYAPDQVEEVKNDAGVVTGYKPKSDAKPTALNTNLVNPNVANTADAPNAQTTSATQLGNVANGANTFETPKVDENGNNLTKVGDNYYAAGDVNADGTVKNGATPVAADKVSDVKLANDGKWYKASDVDTKGTPAANAKPVTPTNPGNAGLIDFANSNPNNAATVGDLQNMGWVVSTSDKDGKETYNNQVRNNNKVDFTGEGLATVTGKTLEDGTRQITVSVKKGEVVPTDKDQNTGTATITGADGKPQTINVVKASDGNWYPADQVTRTTDTNGNTVINPNQGATAIAQNNVTVPNAGSGLVTGNQVGDAIQQSGWNVGLADKAKADDAFGDSSKALSADKLEKVNPDDNVRFADGKGTKVSAATVEEVNKDGKKVTNTYVKVDIDAGEVKANENGSVSGPVTKEISDNLTKANDDLAKANQAVTDADNNVAKAQKAIDDATSAGQPISANLQKALDDAKAAQTTAQAGRTTAQNAQSAAQNAFNNAGNQVATAQNVADAINNSGFNLKTSGNKVPGTQDNGELIKPSNTVEMIAGKNLTVKQDTNGKVTYETANDVQFNSVQFGGNNGPKIDSNGSALNVNGAKIDGVADGDISPNSKEAVNGGQIYALTRGDVPNTTNITTTVTNPDGSTTTKTYENVIADKDGKPILTTYNVYGQTEVITNSTLTAIRNMNEQGIKFFHTNDAEAKPIVEDQNKIDSSAAGAYATAVGFQAKANGTNAVAMGKGSQALAENTIAIGTGNIVSATKSGAFGDPNYIDGKEVDGVATVSGSYAFGNDNVINSSNTFVLGNNVNNKGTTTNGRPDAIGTTVENSVYLGNQTTATAGDGSRTGTLRNLDVNGNQGSTTTAGSTGTVSQAVVGNLTYGGFAGAKANGVVSVGAAGSERRIQNVAAGEISATSTDAINGSQLYSVARGVSNLAGQVNKMGKRMDANAAAAMAAANLLQAYREGQSAVTAGVGQHRGQAAVAVGYSRLSDSGKIGIKFSLSADTQGEVSTGAGIGYFW